MGLISSTLSMVHAAFANARAANILGGIPNISVSREHCIVIMQNSPELFHELLANRSSSQFG